MKLFPGSALTTALVLGNSPLVFAEQPQTHPKPISDPSSQIKQAPPQPQNDFVNGVIRGIDRQLGLVDLDTEIGKMQIQLAPEDLQSLHVGDTIQVRVLNSEMNVT